MLSKRSRPLSGPPNLDRIRPRGRSGLPDRLRRAGVGYALLGEAGLRRAVQVLRLGLVGAALLGKAVQGGAVQALAGRLDRAAVVGRGRSDDAKRRDDDGKRFHVFLPGWPLHARN